MTEPRRTTRCARVVFADLGRAIGALLVVYSNVTVYWGAGEHRLSSHLLDDVTRYPLHLSAQGVGQVAVPFFFILSGFVVTPTAIADGGRRFAVKRVVRIWPLLAVAVGLAVLMTAIGLHPLRTGPRPTVTPVSVLANLTLVNYFVTPRNVVVAVAWTLAVEVLFYLLLLALIPLFRRSVRAAIGVELAFVAVVLALAPLLGAGFQPFAVSVSFLPAVVVGQLCWAAQGGRISIWAAAVFGAVAWALYISADLLHLGRVNGSYDIALAYAIALFVIGMLVEPRLRPHRWISYLSERSYAIYLLHGVVLFPLLDLVSRFVPVLVALPIGLAATLAVVELVAGVLRPRKHNPVAVELPTATEHGSGGVG